MSYVRFDDEHENGRLTEFCKRLSGEVRLQTGEAFHIFQDRNDIAWGQQWEQRIGDSIDVVTFLIPIITPGFLKSRPCRAEWERFIEREKRFRRNDLILPVYYVNCPILHDEARWQTDSIAKVIAGRQYADWRELRFEPFTSPAVGKTIARMATQVVEALEREKPEQPAVVATSKQASPGDLPIEMPGREPARQSAEVARGPALKTEPPTLVVDALNRGHYLTVTDALSAAKPGDRILVRPGLYKEGIVIDKPVEIIGDGELGDVVIEATGKNTVLFKANMGRIANLALRQSGGGNWFCIDIGQGRLDIEGCDISSQSAACVGIHGGADPRLRRNRIHDGKDCGVHVYDNGQGTLEDNEIVGNALAGVEIKTGGNPTLRRNRIHDGKDAGVAARENCQGTLEDNEIYGNALAGVAIATGGNPTVRRNRIHDGKSAGVYIYESGQGTLEDNEIFGNALAGVQIRTGGNPTLRRNRIHDGKDAGVAARENCQGTLEDNEIYGNANSGVEICTGGSPTLRRNRIHDGKNVGVYVHNAGLGILEDNDIFGNANSGLIVETGGNPTLRRNRITKNTPSAIYIHSLGEGLFEGNDLRGNSVTAWIVSLDCLPIVKRTGNQE